MAKFSPSSEDPKEYKGFSTENLNKQRFRFDDNDVIWLFGYGSLIFKADFQYAERRPAMIQGWERRFWQGSHDHRGTENSPGRVVTLIENQGSVCHGMAYQITADNLGHLDYREKNGYLRFSTTLTFKDRPEEEGLVYIATADNEAFLGHAPERMIARQIATSAGPSGTNIDYLLRLADALRELNAVDPHVFAIEKFVQERLDHVT
jgi:cation transport regulator ChaC